MKSPIPSELPKPLHDDWFIQAPDDTRRWLMWFLIWVGVSLVLFASPLGKVLATGAGGSNSSAWNPDKAREVALNLRCAGAMSFAFGLVERIALEIAKMKPGANSS